MNPSSAQPTIVVPCFNEADRLDIDALGRTIACADARVLVVDDGSTDATAALVARLIATHPDHADVLTLSVNMGKGEAVRQGMRRAVAEGAPLVGYCDADMATPPEEVGRLLDTLRHRPELDVVLGARVAMLGHRIERSMVRHYLGRLFATASSAVLGLAVYDTQCGAKMFRDTAALRAALEQPFASRWAFDVELLGRLERGRRDGPRVERTAFVEVPLRAWSDKAGSKLRTRDALTAAVDLVSVARALRAWSS